MRKLITLMAIGLTGIAAHAYIPAPGVKGKLTEVASGTLVCMDKTTRQISTVSDKIGPGNYLGVIANVDDFTIVSVDLVGHVVSIASHWVDDANQAFCRIDLNSEEFSGKTALTGL
jgi:hypothetical protein